MYKFHSAGMIQSIWYSHKVNVRIGFINYENQMIKNNIFILILIVYWFIHQRINRLNDYSKLFTIDILLIDLLKTSVISKTKTQG